MLDFIRRHNRIVLIILAILVIPSFVFFGVSSYTSFISNEVVLAKVGETKITQDAFNQTWRERLNTMRQEQGERFDLSKADTLENRQMWLDRLIRYEVASQLARQAHLGVGIEILRQAIASNPAFEQDGMFSPERYRQFLQANQISAEAYERYLASQLAVNQVVAPVEMSAQLSQTVSDQLKNRMDQVRTIKFRNFLIKDYEKGLKVSDEEAKTWYEAHKEQLRIPELVAVDYILLDQAAATQAVNQQVTDEQMKQYYEQNIHKYVTPERRRISHLELTIPKEASEQSAVAKKAQDLAQEAQKDPTKFSDLVKTYSDDLATRQTGGSLGYISENEFGKLSKVAYQTPAGHVSAPVQYEGAWHILYVNQVDEGSRRTFEQVKSEIKHEIELQLAAEKFASMAEKLRNETYDNHDSLDTIAAAVQLPVHHVDSVAASGVYAEAGQQDATATRIFNLSKVREVLFSKEVLKNAQNSGVIELSPSEQLVLRVSKVTPSYIPAYEDALTRVKSKVLSEKAAILAKSAAENYKGKVFSQELDVSLIDPKGLSLEDLNRIMTAPTDQLPSRVILNNPSAYILIEIVKVDRLSGEQAKWFEQLIVPRFDRSLGVAEADAFAKDLRQLIKVEIYPEAESVLNPEQE